MIICASSLKLIDLLQWQKSLSKRVNYSVLQLGRQVSIRMSFRFFGYCWAALYLVWLYNNIKYFNLQPILMHNSWYNLFRLLQ